MSVLEARQKWADALKSGTYAQGKDRLRDSDRFCCLGVLCDLYAKEHPETKWDDEEMFVMGSGDDDGRWSDLAPEVVGSWAGITQSEMSLLAETNDGGETFENIAEMIIDMRIPPLA